MRKLHPDPITDAASRTSPAASVWQRIFALSSPAPANDHPARWIAGTALIAGSFLVYLAYPIILFALPFSAGLKLGASVAIWLLSWGAFAAGVFLAGPEGLERVKRLWRGSKSAAPPERY